MKGKTDWYGLPPEELEKKMTERQRRFVREYLRNGGNGTEAAISAGYSPKAAHVQASRLLQDDKIAAYRRAQARILYQQAGLEPEQIGMEILGIFRRCMQAEPHMAWNTETKQYEPDGSFVFDAKNALRALELLGKMGGSIRERVELSAPKEETSLGEMLRMAEEVLTDAEAGGHPAPGGAPGNQ